MEKALAGLGSSNLEHQQSNLNRDSCEGPLGASELSCPKNVQWKRHIG